MGWNFYLWTYERERYDFQLDKYVLIAKQHLVVMGDNTACGQTPKEPHQYSRKARRAGQWIPASSTYEVRPNKEEMCARCLAWYVKNGYTPWRNPGDRDL